MSKFENFDVHGGNNQFGNNNTQSNVTNNNHHHHNNNGSKSDSDQVIPIIFGACAGLIALLWLFFSHIDQVYFYLNIATLSSACLSFFSIIVLISTGNIAKEDVFRFLGCASYSIGLFGIAMLARNHAPQEAIQLSQQVKFMEFWNALTSHEQNLVIANFLSAISIGMAALMVHFGSLRQLAYSLAKPNRTGFFYRIYSLTTAFKMRFVSTVVAIFGGFVWAAINGQLPSISA